PQYVPLDPRGEAVAVAADLVPAAVERVVAVVVAVCVGRMSAARCERDGVDHPRRKHDAARTELESLHDLLDGDDRTVGREDDLLLHADDPPKLDVAAAIRLLSVDDPDVGPVSRNRRELLARERADDRDDASVRGEIGVGVAAEDAEGEIRRAR